MNRLEKYRDLELLVGRLFFSSMFLIFAYGKTTDYPGTVAYMSSLHLPEPALFTLLAIVIEAGGGLLMLIGVQARMVALGLAVYVLVTGFIGHSQLTDPDQFMHFMKNMAIVGGSLAFVASGSGAYSLEGARGGDRTLAMQVGVDK